MCGASPGRGVVRADMGRDVRVLVACVRSGLAGVSTWPRMIDLANVDARTVGRSHRLKSGPPLSPPRGIPTTIGPPIPGQHPHLLRFFPGHHPAKLGTRNPGGPASNGVAV